MPNLLNQSPIIIQAVMASSYKALVASTLGTLFTTRIEKIYWEQPTTAGDTVQILGPGAQELVRMRCENAGQSQILDWVSNPRLWQDFQVARLDSGNLYIYTR